MGEVVRAFDMRPTIPAPVLFSAPRLWWGRAMEDESIEIFAGFIGGILLELDREGQYLRVLTGDSQLLARPASDLPGRTVREVLGPAAEPFEAMFRRVVDTGVAETYDYTLDVPAGR